MRKQSGFTLIEIAIVLVIIGLLLGGVLKGQELITSARVRNLISQQDGVKAAYFGFLDRFRALPGDYSQAIGQHRQRCSRRQRQRQRPDHRNADRRRHDRRAHRGVGPSVEGGFINGSYTYAAVTETTTQRADQSLRSLHPADLRHRLRQRRDAADPPQPEDRQPDSVRHHGRDRPQDRRRQSDRAATSSSRPTTAAAPAASRRRAAAPASATPPARRAWSSATVDTNCGGASLF